LVAAGGHGRAAEAEKDCNGDYAERFHDGISKLIGRCRLPTELCGLAAGTIKLAFRKLNSILVSAGCLAAQPYWVDGTAEARSAPR
jgi:hypothetical protein